MMWIVIISIIVLVLGKFLFDKYSMEISLRRKGGMKVVYAELISLLLAQHPASKIFNESASYISLGVADTFTVTLFELVAAFRSVIVVYKVRSKFYGDHRLEWTFPDSDDPEFMVFKMQNDIKSYIEKVMQSK